MYCSQLILSWALVKCIWQRFIVYGQQRIAIVRSFWPLYFLNRWAKSSGIVMVKFIRHNHHHFSAVFYTCFFTGVAQNNKLYFVILSLSMKMHLSLTLIGMRLRQGTFHPLVFFGSDFDSWVFIKNFWRWKLRSIGLIWHAVELIESSYKTCP